MTTAFISRPKPHITNKNDGAGDYHHCLPWTDGVAMVMNLGMAREWASQRLSVHSISHNYASEDENACCLIDQIYA